MINVQLKGFHIYKGELKADVSLMNVYCSFLVCTGSERRLLRYCYLSKERLLDARNSSVSHTYRELSEQLPDNVSQVVFFSTCELSVHKTVLSSNCLKYLTNSTAGEHTVN